MGERAKGAWLLGFVWLGGFRGLDMRFLGEKNGKRKNRSQFDFAQGRLCGMTKINRSLRLFGIGGWVPHISESRCGAPLVSGDKLLGYAGRSSLSDANLALISEQPI
jgi:hypothetical protein